MFFVLLAKQSKIRPKTQILYFSNPFITTIIQGIQLAKIRFQRYVNGWFKKLLNQSAERITLYIRSNS
jgi:hypothetical protein